MKASDYISKIEDTLREAFNNRRKSPEGEYLYIESEHELAKKIYKDIEYLIDKEYEQGYDDGYDEARG